MNLLIINSAKEWGGTEKWAVFTARGLAARGHIVYFGCRGELFDHRFAGSSVVPVKFPFSNHFDLLTIARLYFFMRKNKIDAVLPSKQREYFLAGLAAKLGKKTKVVGMFAIDRPIHNLRTRIVFCKLFDMVLVVAKKIIDVLAQTPAFDVKKCRIVYQGVEPIVCSKAVREKHRSGLGIGENEICIMGIGRLSPQKGIDYAIRSIAFLSKRIPCVKLVIVGSGDQTQYRQCAIEEQVADKVLFTGFRYDVPELLQAADIFWISSRSEGIPNVMIEAMMAAIPVVSFDIAGIAEVLQSESNGLLVPFGDTIGLANSTERLIADKALRDRIATNGQVTVANEFSMEKMCRDTENYLMELLVL